MIYDIFPFFNELDILELRLRELDGIVDRFIVVQSEETHAGTPKPIYFNPDHARWEPWQGRISTVLVARIPDAKTRWVRENAARHVMADALAEAHPDDLVIMSDVDEIPDKTVLARSLGLVRGDEWVGFSTRCYYYYLNLRIPMPYKCIALSRVETLRTLGAQTLRNRKNNPPIGPIRGGWHFTFQGGIPAIQEKFAAFAHAEYDTDQHKDTSFLADCIANLKLPLRGKWRHLQWTTLDELPDEVRKHPHRYAHLMS